MVKNGNICKNCPFRDKIAFEQKIFSQFEKEIEKTRKITNEEEKNKLFFLIIKNCLNGVEIHSCLNCLSATGEEGEPEEKTMEMYFCNHANGARLLGEKKFFEILDEIGDSYNRYFTGEEIHREPDVWDDFKHFVLNGGLEVYYQRHPEYLL